VYDIHYRNERLLSGMYRTIVRLFSSCSPRQFVGDFSFTKFWFFVALIEKFLDGRKNTYVFGCFSGSPYWSFDFILSSFRVVAGGCFSCSDMICDWRDCLDTRLNSCSDFDWRMW
jgi:hypothetical protein